MQIIPLRKNFRTVARGSPLRHRTARQIRKIGEEEWKRIHNYGRRWIVGIYFSGLKRVMGEVIKARKLECVIQEIGLKVLYYNYLRSDTRAIRVGEGAILLFYISKHDCEVLGDAKVENYEFTNSIEMKKKYSSRLFISWAEFVKCCQVKCLF